MNLLVFDLEITGHHPGYIRHLLRYWPDDNSTLNLVVSPEFLVQHLDVVQTETQANVAWHPIAGKELAWYKASKQSLLRHTWAEWRLFCRYAKKIKADQGLVMMIDRFQLPLGLRLPVPCAISGIYFQPKFHYTKLAGHQTSSSHSHSNLREQLLWRSALHHPALNTLFCLDPLAVEPLRILGNSKQVVHLPDPVEFVYQQTDDVEKFIKQLDLDPKRKVFLLFGVLDKRKGIYQILESLTSLSFVQQEKLALLLVGKLAGADRLCIRKRIEKFKSETSIQIILEDKFIEESAVPTYFNMADVVLALYQNHVGSSGILLWAAAAGKPVMASNYGLMGELVRQHRLGLTLDSSRPDVIAEAIGTLLVNQQPEMFDLNSATEFVSQNSPEYFVQTIWRGLGVKPCIL